MTGYCWTCGWHTSAMTPPADLDPDTKMCRWCRDHWAPRGDHDRHLDLGRPRLTDQERVASYARLGRARLTGPQERRRRHKNGHVHGAKGAEMRAARRERDMRAAARHAELRDVLHRTP